MAGFYVHNGWYNSLPNEILAYNNWIVSIGTLCQPQVVHFKSEADLIAYLHGHNETLKDERIKTRYKEIEKTLDADVRDVIWPEWKWTHRQKIRRFVADLLRQLKMSGLC